MIYDQLPVFKETYDLLQHVFKFSSKLTKDYRYTIGEKLKNEIIDICVEIYNANATRDKIPYISSAREKIVTIKMLTRILYDMKQISLKQYTTSAEKTESISKQLSAWNKSLKEKSIPKT